jgi:hypothetical protein
MRGLVHISRIINGMTKSYSQEYLDYMNSAAWQYRRAQAIQRARGWCERCHKNAAREVHHKTYANFGRELLQDLMAVCHHCHVILDQERERE